MVTKTREYVIGYSFINDDLIGLPADLVEYLEDTHIYEFNDDTTMSDFYNSILTETWGEGYSRMDDDNLKYYIKILVGGRLITASMSFNMREFIVMNDIHFLQLEYVICPGGGAGGLIDYLYYINIRPEESKHFNRPHIHLYKNSYKYNGESVVFGLWNLKPIDSTEKMYKKLFNKKQRDIFEEFLGEYQEKLINYYNSVQNGENPEPIYINRKGEIVIFK